MKRLQLPIILTLLAGLPGFLAAKPKIATIDANRITEEYHLAKRDKKIFESEQTKIEEDRRKKAASEMGQTLKKQAEVLRDTPENDENRARLLEEAQQTQKYYNDLLGKWRKFRLESLQALTETYVQSSEMRSKEILNTAREVSNSMGYDLVLDISGITSSKMPVVLYVRDATDITDQVLELLNKGADEQNTTDEESTESTESPGEPTGSDE